MKFKLSLFFLLLALPLGNAHAGFGPVKVVDQLKINRIYQGNGPSFVTFSGPNLSECSENGGYLQPSWKTANLDDEGNGYVDDAATARMLSVILAAKAMDTTIEVRYMVNDAGTGWSNCAITGIYSR